MLVERLRRERSHPDASALDLCTGSGVLAIAAAQVGYAPVVAVDVSRAAVATAALNARLNGVHVDARRGDLFSPVVGRRFDLIVVNPPYVPSPLELPRQGLARAWEGGEDGRVFIDRICDEAAAHLHPGGVLLLVHSGVCGEQASLDALRSGGLDAGVVQRHRGPLGPILQGRQDWLRSRGLLAGDEEELLVIRAQAAARENALRAESPRGSGAHRDIPRADMVLRG